MTAVGIASASTPNNIQPLPPGNGTGRSPISWPGLGYSFNPQDHRTDGGELSDLRRDLWETRFCTRLH